MMNMLHSTNSSGYAFRLLGKCDSYSDTATMFTFRQCSVFKSQLFMFSGHCTRPHTSLVSCSH